MEIYQLQLFVDAPVIRDRPEILEFERLINECKALDFYDSPKRIQRNFKPFSRFRNFRPSAESYSRQ
jgi:hypothetical protein